MNPDHARKSLDAKLSSMGYVHPTTTNNNNSQYMSYSDDNKGDYFSSNYDPYAIFNTEEITGEIKKNNNCPMCSGRAMYQCNCSLADMMCKKGHIWFVLKNGSVKIGDPHEND